MAYKRKATKKWSKKKFPKRAKKSSFAAKVKKVILRTSEPKTRFYGHNVVAPKELFHDSYSVPYELDGTLQMPLQGVSDVARVGDEIYASRIAVKMLLGMKSNRHNVTFRILVVKCTPGAKPTSYDQLFHTSADNCLLDDINRDRVSVIKDMMIKKEIHPDLSGVGGADKEFTFPVKFNVACKEKIKFPVDGDTTASNRKLRYMFVFAYDAFGTLVTDNIAYSQLTTTLYYRDP